VIQELLDAIKRAIAGRRVAYRQVFRSPNGERVLADLARFCRANVTTMHPDARAHALAEGRREVWLHIQEQLQLTEDELWTLYRPVGVPPQS
jgi:hypothetical protein